jgi:hypothetical protein
MYYYISIDRRFFTQGASVEAYCCAQEAKISQAGI